MKTINKTNLLLILFIGLIITACGNEDVVRDPSPAQNPNSSNAYFDSLNVFNPILPIDGTSFDMIIGREKTDVAQVIDIVASGTHIELFEVPSSVSFAAGEAKKTITINVKDIELMEKYYLTLQLDPAQTNLYSIQRADGKIVYGRAEIIVLKEDFEPFAEGTYSSLFFEESWDALLEYSPATEIYRFKDCWMPGYNVTFTWEDTEVSIIGTKNSTATFVYLQTGYVDPTYGMIRAFYSLADQNYYNTSTKTFTFPITWVIPDGRSFGAYNDTFTITKEL